MISLRIIISWNVPIHSYVYLNLYPFGLYVNFSTWFMKNIIWTEKTKIIKQQHFVENETDYAAYLTTAVNFFVA
jgi:hypothetical protein